MNSVETRQAQLLSRKLRDQLIESPYVWPGGYPLHAVTSDGGRLCKDCCKSEFRSIGSTYPGDGWTVVGVGVNWEDTELYCDHCGNLIESAYGES